MTAATPYATDTRAGDPLAATLFGFIFLFAFVSLSPFGDLSAEGGSLALDQLAALALALLALGFAAARGLLPMVLRPRLVLTLVFGWLAIAALLAPDAATALRRLFVTGLVALNASLLLVLPRNSRGFAMLSGVCVSIVLALCYIGVLVIPGRAIHQAGDLFEPQLAGDWRGVFDHKNVAAPAMVILVFFSLYLTRAWSGLAWGLAALALVFLVATNGKTALALMPLALILAFVAENRPRTGAVLIVGLLLAFNLLTVGAAFVPAIGAFVESLGVDATFTARADVWNLALTAAAEHPLMGYGFQSFWQSEALLSSDFAYTTWAVNAAHAHNAYIEAVLDGGLVAMGLVVVWLVVLPLRDAGLAQARRADPLLTRLYLRIWLFGLFSACLESSFFSATSPVWFAILVAVFGLYFQARADLRPGVEGAQS